MKLVVLISLLPALALAQLSSKNQRKLNELRYYDDWGLNSIQQIYYYSKKDQIKGSLVESVKYISVKRNGKERLSYTKWYNESGKVVKTANKRDTVYIDYQDSLVIATRRHTEKHRYRTKYAYDEQQRIISREEFKDDQLTQSTHYGYYMGKQKTFIERKTFGKNAHTYRLENSYDTLLHRVSKTVFLVDGKLKQQWNYECNEKGKIVDTKIETTNSQCLFEQENLDGSYSIFTRSIINGKVKLTESLYSADSVYLGYRSYEKDSVLTQSYLINGNLEESKIYSRKGKVLFHQERVFDTFGNQLAHYEFDKKGNRRIISTCVYNAKNLLTEVTFTKNFKQRFEYTFH